MAIIKFDFTKGEPTRFGGEPWPEGAYCPLRGEEHGAGHLVLWHTHAGLCLYDYERNGYDDSDFYMVVWNPEKGAPEEICFASTRGWSYPAYDSKPDATPEVLVAYEAWKVRQAEQRERARRHAKATALREQHAAELTVCGLHGITLASLRRWKRTEHQDQWERAFKLLASTRLRSRFRISLRDRAVAWLKDAEAAYPSPYSRRQWEYV